MMLPIDQTLQVDKIEDQRHSVVVRIEYKKIKMIIYKISIIMFFTLPNILIKILMKLKKIQIFKECLICR